MHDGVTIGVHVCEKLRKKSNKLVKEPYTVIIIIAVKVSNKR